jgi:hypothetical protein
MTTSRFLPILLVSLGCGALVACTVAAPKTRHLDPVDPGPDFGLDDSPDQQQPIGTDVNGDSGAFGASQRPSGKGKDASAGKPDAAVVVVDGGGPDSGTVGRAYCAGPLAAGDLVVTELMITSRAGSGDDGEWVEITSTRDCWLALKGVSIESPRGAGATDSTTIDQDLDLAPGGTFIVADSADPAANHSLPGTLFAWNATDVLKNTGDTVTVKSGDTVLDTITYPAFSNLEPGRTLAFPSDCTPGDRADWQRWSLTFDSWTAGFEGTPNAVNTDVACY